MRVRFVPLTDSPDTNPEVDQDSSGQHGRGKEAERDYVPGLALVASTAGSETDTG